jgi:hypothetical protein
MLDRSTTRRSPGDQGDNITLKPRRRRSPGDQADATKKDVSLKPRRRRRAGRGSKKRDATKNVITVSHAARQRAYADRIRHNERLLYRPPLKITERRISVLCKLRWLNEVDVIHSDAQIAAAIEGLLDSLWDDE